MDIRQLGYFIEVAKTKSFTKASRNLHVSQPALSKSIRQLEDELEILLIDRDTKTFEVTKAGRIVLEESGLIIKHFDNIQNAIFDLRNSEGGDIKIGLSPILGALFFLDIIDEYQDLYKEVTLQLCEYGSKAITQHIIPDKLDVAITILPEYTELNMEAFDYVTVYSSQTMFLAYKGHPLAKKESVTLEDIKDESFILLNDEFLLYDNIMGLCKNSQIKPKMKMVTSQFNYIMDMVSQKKGVSILPKPMMDNHNRIESLVSIPFEPIFPWRVALVYPKNRYLSVGVKNFLKLVQKSFEGK